MTCRTEAKTQALTKSGSLHLHPEGVSDPLFQNSDFFDPRDLIQVKYEMLRRVRIDQHTVTQAVRAFGFSRPVYYQALTAFEAHGLPGLIPKKPGPRQAHKLTDQVMAYVESQRSTAPSMRGEMLAQKVRQRFGINVHPRSVERALARRVKKGR